MAEPLLRIRGLSLRYESHAQSVSALDSVSLEILEGETVGIVGETGCGKSTLALAIMRLTAPTARIDGEILFRGRNLLGVSNDEMRRIRGASIGMVFQDPLSSLDPYYSIGSQVADTIEVHRKVRPAVAREAAIALLREVGIASAEARYHELPSQFSGGMRQRVVIAAALANNPALLLADEPTSALDTTVQAQILRKLSDMAKSHGTATMLISHDLGVVAQSCDRVGVMYAGQLVEFGTTAEIYEHPRHPYTQALLGTLPRPSVARGSLQVIEGGVPDLSQPPSGCRFTPRCPARMPTCDVAPAVASVGPGHTVACWLYTDAPRDGAAVGGAA